MHKIDFTQYNVKPAVKLPAYRFQDLVLEAFLLFKMDPKGKGMIWGRIGKAKKTHDDSYIEAKIQFAITETKELKPKSPGRYFVKLIFKYL